MPESGVDLNALQSLLAAGQFAEAYQTADTALAHAPDDLALMVVRANAAIGLRAPEQIIAALNPVIERRPQNPVLKQRLAGALNLRGCRYSRDAQWELARADFRNALEHDPTHPQAWFNLALAYRALEQPDQVINALQRHLALNPDDHQANLVLASMQGANEARQQLRRIGPHGDTLDQGWLAYTAVRAGMLDECVRALQQVSTDSNYIAAQDAMTELRLRGEAQRTAQCAPHLIAVGQQRALSSARVELIQHLALPAIYQSATDLQQWRDRFAAGLSALELSWSPLQDGAPPPAFADIAHSNFLLAYQGLDDRELQRRYARLLRRCVERHFPALLEWPGASGGRRVGLLSSCWRNCTVGHYFSEWIQWLSRMGLEVYLYQLGPQRDQVTDQLAASTRHFKFLSGKLEAIAETVRQDQLDLLIYPEVGMDARILPLLACRLAARTAVGWGHPMTSGFDHVDAYFSCAAMELPNAQQHYVEPLRLLDGLGVDYRHTPQPAVLARDVLGLPVDQPTVLVPQSLFKLHPQFDSMMAELAALTPQVMFVLFEPEYPEWKRDYMARLSTCFAAYELRAEQHVLFMPRSSRERYLLINQACDLMLDSLHWSGGNTAIDALQSGLPVVTCAGEYMRARQTHAMLDRMAVADELSCATPASTVQRCVELLSDAAKLRELRAQLLARRGALFEAGSAERSFRAHVSELLATPPRSA